MPAQIQLTGTQRPTVQRSKKTKAHQISVRLGSEADAWLERRAGGRQNKAELIRQLIENEMARERERELLAMFNAAAAEVSEEERDERDQLLGAFAATE